MRREEMWTDVKRCKELDEHETIASPNFLTEESVRCPYTSHVMICQCGDAIFALVFLRS